MIIAVTNPKGGVGKTSTSMLIAAVFAHRGDDVTVIDLDRQGTALDWAERVEERNEADGDSSSQLPFAVELSIPRQVEKLAARIGKKGVAIIDTPPGDPDAIEAAIAASDFVIVPTRATNADLSRVWALQDALDDVPHAALLTFARKGTNALEITRAALDGQGMPRFKAEISLREAVHSTFGFVPSGDFHGYDDVATEILEMMK